ncbi:hypothetical protein CJT61_30960, partial [Pseudomonas aeruginosa]
MGRLGEQAVHRVAERQLEAEGHPAGTAADGLAVGRPSGFVGRAMQRLLDGYYTVDDDELFRLLALLE